MTSFEGILKCLVVLIFCNFPDNALMADEFHFVKIGLIRVKNGCSRVKFVAILSLLQKCNSFFGSYKHKGDNWTLKVEPWGEASKSSMIFVATFFEGWEPGADGSVGKQKHFCSFWYGNSLLSIDKWLWYRSLVIQSKALSQCQLSRGRILRRCKVW